MFHSQPSCSSFNTADDSKTHNTSCIADVEMENSMMLHDHHSDSECESELDSESGSHFFFLQSGPESDSAQFQPVRLNTDSSNSMIVEFHEVSSADTFHEWSYETQDALSPMCSQSETDNMIAAAAAAAATVSNSVSDAGTGTAGQRSEKQSHLIDVYSHTEDYGSDMLDRIRGFTMDLIQGLVKLNNTLTVTTQARHSDSCHTTSSATILGLSGCESDEKKKTKTRPNNPTLRIFFRPFRDNAIFDEVTSRYIYEEGKSAQDMTWRKMTYPQLSVKKSDNKSNGIVTEFLELESESGSRPVHNHLALTIEMLKTLTPHVATGDSTRARELYYCNPAAYGNQVRSNRIISRICGILQCAQVSIGLTYTARGWIYAPTLCLQMSTSDYLVSCDQVR
jgi:Type IIB DNA topoisomerase